MSPRLSIIAGLITGILAGALVFGGIIAFAPAPVPSATALPQPSLAASSVPSATALPQPSLAASPVPSASLTPVASASPAATASATIAPSPSSNGSSPGGSGAALLGGIGPDSMARGLRSILPGVTVTP